MEKEPIKSEIINLYKKNLGRIPEKEGLEHFTNQISSGKKILSDIEKAILNSDEYLSRSSAPKFQSHYSDDEILKIIDSVKLSQNCNTSFTWYHSFRFNNVYTPTDSITNTKYQLWVSKLIPENLEGKTILDIGTADGFYSFLCESRGAKKVVAVDWQEFAGFTAAHKILDSKVEFRKLVIDESNIAFTKIKPLNATIDDIKEKFDIILLFGVLYHIPNPVMILKKFFMKTDMLLIAGHIIDSDEPAMYYYPEGSLTVGDSTNWWVPTPSCLTDIGKRIGFKKSVLVDTFDFDLMNVNLTQEDNVKNGVRRIHKMGIFKMEGKSEIWKKEMMSEN